MGMSPAESPNYYVRPEAQKRKVRTVNKNALVLVVILLALASGALVFAAASRSAVPKAGDPSEMSSKGKALTSTPPGNLEGKKGAQVASTGSSSSTAGLPSEVALIKEQQDFERQLRQEQQKRLLAKASLATSAETSDIGVNMNRSDAAAASGLVATYGPTGEAQLGSAPAAVRLATTAGDTAGGLTDPNLQGRKEAFSEKERASGYLPTRKQAQLSPYEVKQGTVIPGIMISGINSDLPGQIIAQVSQNVYDTATGKHLMIPQGTRLVGGYDSYVAVGQERAMVAWRRLQFPDGAVLDILNMPGADEGGYAGFNDQVNNHYVKIFGSAIMLSLVGAGYQLSQPTEHVGDPVTAQNILAAQIGQQLSQVSGEMIRRNMQIQPTIEIRPGYRFNVMVNKDMILEPYVERNP